MQIPIDARERIYKVKYIDEETSMFARWIEFGRDRTDNSVCLHDAYLGQDILTGLTDEQAERILEARNRFCDEIVDTLMERHNGQT
jgi:hypothetical protein